MFWIWVKFTQVSLTELTTRINFQFYWITEKKDLLEASFLVQLNLKAWEIYIILNLKEV